MRKKKVSGHMLNISKSQHALYLGLTGLRELILRPPGRPAAVRPFYYNFDWLNYGLILLVN
jgi:hypothetical protein